MNGNRLHFQRVMVSAHLVVWCSTEKGSLRGVDAEITPTITVAARPGMTPMAVLSMEGETYDAAAAQLRHLLSRALRLDSAEVRGEGSVIVGDP